MTVASDEALAELGFLCQRMTYVCHNGISQKEKVVNPTVLPPEVCVLLAQIFFYYKDFSISLDVPVCMHLGDWHWTKLT